MFGDDILNIYKIVQISSTEGKQTWAWLPELWLTHHQGLILKKNILKINIFHVFPENMHSLNQELGILKWK